MNAEACVEARIRGLRRSAFRVRSGLGRCVCIYAAATEAETEVEAEVKARGGRCKEKGNRATKLGRQGGGECRRTERAGEMARGEERPTRRDGGGYAVGIMRRLHGHLGTGDQVCPAKCRLVRTSPRSESSHPPPGGAVEWIVDMWECFVILSWWG
jgi:hypothetical protein